jgi:hypothetical protein
LNQKKEYVLTVQIPDKKQAKLLEDLIWDISLKKVELRGSGRGPENTLSLSYRKLVSQEHGAKP